MPVTVMSPEEVAEQQRYPAKQFIHRPLGPDDVWWDTRDEAAAYDAYRAAVEAFCVSPEANAQAAALVAERDALEAKISQFRQQCEDSPEVSAARAAFIATRDKDRSASK
jgi:hypothetical protein